MRTIADLQLPDNRQRRLQQRADQADSPRRLHGDIGSVDPGPGPRRPDTVLAQLVFEPRTPANRALDEAASSRWRVLLRAS